VVAGRLRRGAVAGALDLIAAPLGLVVLVAQHFVLVEAERHEFRDGDFADDENAAGVVRPARIGVDPDGFGRHRFDPRPRLLHLAHQRHVVEQQRHARQALDHRALGRGLQPQHVVGVCGPARHAQRPHSVLADQRGALRLEQSAIALRDRPHGGIPPPADPADFELAGVERRVVDGAEAVAFLENDVMHVFGGLRRRFLVAFLLRVEQDGPLGSGKGADDGGDYGSNGVLDVGQDNLAAPLFLIAKGAAVVEPQRLRALLGEPVVVGPGGLAQR
jgi:hypothetical protein